MLGHELRNPLAPIRNAVKIMRQRGSEDPSLCWARDVIDHQVRQMGQLVDDLGHATMSALKHLRGEERTNCAANEARACLRRRTVGFPSPRR